MIARLSELGLVEKGEYQLTLAGTSAALVVTSRLKAALRLAQDVLALDGEEAREWAAHLAVNAHKTLGRGLVNWNANAAGERRIAD